MRVKDASRVIDQLATELKMGAKLDIECTPEFTIESIMLITSYTYTRNLSNKRIMYDSVSRDGASVEGW